MRAALAGGADAIQLRDKESDSARLTEIGRALAPHIRAAGALFLVNDNLDVARRVGADGLHLGPNDLPIEEARISWPRPALLGGSARTVKRALELQAAGADYLGVGPVFGTTTKPDAPGAIGLEVLARIAASVRIPILGIGGIDETNAALVLVAGAAGVAVISSVVGAADPEAATRSLRRALDATAAQLLE